MLAHLCSACVIYFATIHLMIIPVDGYTAIGEVKRHSFLCASVVFVILILFLSLELWLVQTSRKKHKKPRNLETICFFIAAFLYLGFTALSGVASPYSGVFWGNTRYDGILTIGLYVICALILSELLVPQRWMLELFGLTVCLFCLIGITQLAGTNPFNLYPGDYSFYDAGIYYAGQYWSTIGNVNLCAALLSVASGSFIAAFVCGNGLRIWLCMVPLSLSVFSIFSLNSEAGIVSILFGSLLIAPFIVTDMKSVGKLFCAYGDMSFTIVVSRCCLFSVDGVTFSISKAPFVLVLISRESLI